MKPGLASFDDRVSSERVFQTLRVGLGLIWLLDEMMQLEPGVFQPAYYGTLPSSVMPSVLQYIHERAPAWISWAVGITQWFFNHWPIATNLFMILIEMGLAACLLVKLPDKYRRVGLWGSLVWGLVVWVSVQTLGGAQSWAHGLTFYAGFPGSALFSACTAGLLLLSRYGWSVQALSKMTIRVVAGILWVCGIIQLLPSSGQWQAANQMFVFGNSAFQQYQPNALRAPIMAYSLWFSGHPIANNLLLGMALFCAGTSVWFWQRSRFARGYVYIWLFTSWWFGMDFGNMFSGLCTDLNTPPILFVMLFAFRPISLTVDTGKSARNIKSISVEQN